ECERRDPTEERERRDTARLAADLRGARAVSEDQERHRQREYRGERDARRCAGVLRQDEEDREDDAGGRDCARHREALHVSHAEKRISARLLAESRGGLRVWKDLAVRLDATSAVSIGDAEEDAVI